MQGTSTLAGIGLCLAEGVLQQNQGDRGSGVETRKHAGLIVTPAVLGCSSLRVPIALEHGAEGNGQILEGSFSWDPMYLTRALVK